MARSEQHRAPKPRHGAASAGASGAEPVQDSAYRGVPHPRRVDVYTPYFHIQPPRLASSGHHRGETGRPGDGRNGGGWIRRDLAAHWV